MMPVAAIADKWGIERVIVSTYQAVSGAGRLSAILERADQLRQVYDMLDPKRFDRYTFRLLKGQEAINCV